MATSNRGYELADAADSNSNAFYVEHARLDSIARLHTADASDVPARGEASAAS